MEAAAFSTGVSIQYPHGRSAANISSNHHNVRVEYPFPFPATAKTSSERHYTSDTEAYSACQELAYHFAYEKTRQAVQELLRKNNDTSYTQVLRFFEKYCAREALAANGATTPSPSSRRLRDPNAPVLFPGFHAFPTAAVIAGTDATSSDLWVEPLTQKLRWTFPLCLLAPRDVSTARKFIEWLAARIAKLCAAKTREEKWLEGLVDNFDLLPLDKPPIAAGSVGRSVTRHQQAKELRAVKDDKEKGEKDEQSDDSLFISSSESETSDDDDEFGVRKKKKRRLVSVAYGRWTITKLLTTIQDNIDDLLASNCGDTRREWVAMLGELVHDRLLEAITFVRKVQHKEEEMITQIIACFDEAVEWLQHKIITCKDTAAKLLDFAPESNSNHSATVHIGSTEMALALMLQRVFRQYESFLEECTVDESVMDQRKSVKQNMLKHMDHYMIKSDEPEVFILTPPRSFLLICIEQLEAFSQEVLGDFLQIWTHFVQQQHESRKTTAMRCTLGFVIGVASATSPAIRRLDLTVTNRFELQFFSLVDSRKCFDDVLESLVVNAKLPLSLSGEVLRAIANRQHRLPSVPRLLLAFHFLLFTHFRRCPWSFLALAVDGLSSSGESPILVAASYTPLPHRVSAWVKRLRRRLTREAQGRAVESDVSLASWLLPCSALELGDLSSRVMTSGASGEEDWISVLEAAVLKERRRQARWRMGWRCFRSACSWLDVRIDGTNERDQDKQEQMTAVHLALALEGQLGQAPRFMEVLQRLQNCDRWAMLVALIEDWKASFRASGLNEDEEGTLGTTLNELAMLCAYAINEKTPPKMLAALRQELVDVFTTRLITALLHPPRPGTVTPADALVSSWSVLTDAHVLEKRLRFEYHNNLHNVLQDAGIGDDETSNNADVEASWVHDVGLAFLFYHESASASLSLREWYESFSSELEEESKSAPKSKKKTASFSDDTVIKARFVRAVCTLRHWGFIKSDAPRDSEQDIIEKLVFI